MFRQRKISLLFERVLTPIRRSFSLESESDCSSIPDEEIQFEKKISVDGIITKSLSEPLLSDGDIYSSLEYEEDDETSSESEDDYSVYDEVDTDEELLPELGSFEFSADPTIRCVEAIELADDLLEEAFDLVEKHMDILDDFHFESLESLEERLYRTKEMMSLKEEDLPTTRLLKARIYLNEAESFLTRVHLLIEMSIALEEELDSDADSETDLD
ncbi:hypothetical protein BJ165DRAFT_996433 [Panaeolus papilionaceus]|nr:hypothetical protein BJ165DRAFT_996433 [Panaeolus papilionaceus]